MYFSLNFDTFLRAIYIGEFSNEQPVYTINGHKYKIVNKLSEKIMKLNGNHLNKWEINYKFGMFFSTITLTNGLVFEEY